jgi:hypothetical protein
MKSNGKSSAADIRGATAALRRASRAARKLAHRTNTPFHVWKNGHVVNLNPGSKRTKPHGRDARAT